MRLLRKKTISSYSTYTIRCSGACVHYCIFIFNLYIAVFSWLPKIASGIVSLRAGLQFNATFRSALSTTEAFATAKVTQHRVQRFFQTPFEVLVHPLVIREELPPGRVRRVSLRVSRVPGRMNRLDDRDERSISYRRFLTP